MIKKLILGFSIFISMTIMAGSLFVYFNKDVIVHGIQSHLKKSGLNLEMTNIDVAFFKSFPSVSANVDHMSLANLSSTPVLTAESVSFNLDLARLLSKEIEINEIVIRDGHIQLLRDKNGITNYQFNSSPEETSDKNPIDLDQIKLVDMDFTFRDEKQHHLVRLKDINTTINPTFAVEAIITQLSLTALAEALSISQEPYFFNQKLNLDSELKITKGTLSFEPTILDIGNNQVKFKGNILGLNSNQPKVDITITETKGKIESLSEFLPDHWFQSIETYDISGKYKLRGSIVGKFGRLHLPKIELHANLSAVQLQHNALIQKITDGESELHFIYGASQSEKISLPNFKGRYNQEVVDISFDLNSFSNPTIKTTINGTFKLKDINPELIPEVFLKENGQVVLNDFKLDHSNNTLNYKGQVEATDIVGMMSSIGFEISTGKFDIDNHLVNISPTSVIALEEEHIISGSIDLKKEEYIIDLQSENVDLDNFFIALDSDKTATVKHVNETTSSNPKAVINLTTKNLSYNHIQFDQSQAKIIWKSPKVKIKSKMTYCQGVLHGSATYNIQTGKSTFKVGADHIDMKNLFEQWNNFEQEQITCKHIKGFGDIQCSGSFVYNSNQEWNLNSMNIVGGIRIKNGQLHNVPVLQQFSSFIKIKDLSHIKFTSLNNVFKIEKGRFYLPEMFIQSNAANIILAGHQTLDNKLNYAIKVNAGQVLTKKFKKHDPKLRPSKAKNKGFFNLHYIVKGPIDDFEYFSNKRRVLDKFEQSLFMRDEIIQRLSVNFDIEERYSSPHLFQDIPEMEVEKVEKAEYLPGFE